MHPRRAILDAIRTALAASTSPALPVYEEDETAQVVPCWLIAVGLERRGERTSKRSYHRQNSVSVTALGTSRTERDALSEALELALLGASVPGVLEIEWLEVELETPRDEAGERVYPASYRLMVDHFSPRAA